MQVQGKVAMQPVKKKKETTPTPREAKQQSKAGLKKKKGRNWMYKKSKHSRMQEETKNHEKMGHTKKCFLLIHYGASSLWGQVDDQCTVLY